MFTKYCQGKESDAPRGPIEASLPLKFDAARRTSVSAESWNMPLDGSYSLRMPNGHSNSSSLLQTVGSVSPKALHQRSVKSSLQEKQGETGSLVDNSSAKSASDYIKYSDPLIRVSASLRNTIFFEELSDNLMQVVLQALEERNVPKNTEVIKQGDEGNELFILDSGKVEFLVNGEKQGEAVSGATFGELALLYNSPRAATVRTIVPSTIFALDRVTFKQIMIAKLSEKRQHSQQVLASIDAFSKLPDALRLRISDALHPVSFKSGDVILKEGDLGCNFYLIDEGTVSVSKEGKELTTLTSGRYFGELALIYDLPRAATITAVSDTVKLEVLSKQGFEQLIGPDLVNELRRRDPRKQF